MSNSKLVNYTKLSPNHSGKRTHSIDRITPHGASLFFYYFSVVAEITWLSKVLF